MASNKKNADGLTPFRERFCREYLVDFNGLQAYIRAGGSKNGARQSAFNILARPEAQAFLAKLKAERNERTEVTADRVLLELARVGFSDPRRLFNEDGSLKPIHELDDDTAAAIASVEVISRTGEADGDGGRPTIQVHKIKPWDKNTALDKLARHTGLLVDRTEISASEDLLDVLRAIDGATRGLPNQRD